MPNMIREPNSKQQATDLIRKHQNILILTHLRPDHDAIASSIALKLALAKMGKKADVVIPDGVPNDSKFLPGHEDVLEEFSVSRDILVKIQSPTGKVGKISYQKDSDNGVGLIISPESGEIKKEHITIEQKGHDYDLIIVLDVPGFDRLGDIYEKNKDIFGKLPIVNIDHHDTNKNFGTANLVNKEATSTSEILVSLLEALDKDLLDKDIATLLLTGILTDTDRFQNSNTTPKSLTVAAQLIAAGASRSEIIRNVYKTNSIDVLKLWGIVLSNIKEDKANKVVWSKIPYQDFSKHIAAEDTLVQVVQELLVTAPGAEIIFLLVERKPGLVTGHIRSIEGVESDKIASAMGGGGHKYASGFSIEGMSINQVEGMMLEKIQEYRSGKIVERAPINEPEEVMEEVIVEPDEIEESDKESTAQEDDNYSPSISDIDLEQPKISEDKNSILQRIIKSREEKNRESIDFSKLEEQTKKSTPHIVVNDWDEDDNGEDYE